jgi:hypothetical protein
MTIKKNSRKMKWLKLDFVILLFHNNYEINYKYWDLWVQKLIIIICEGKYIINQI